MRYASGLAVMLLPVAASAQMFEGPTATIPVARCEQAAPGVACTRVVDGAALTASGDYVRIDRPLVGAPRQVARTETTTTSVTR